MLHDHLIVAHDRIWVVSGLEGRVQRAVPSNRVLSIVIAGRYIANKRRALPHNRRKLTVFQAAHVSTRIQHRQGRDLAAKLRVGLSGRLQSLLLSAELECRI